MNPEAYNGDFIETVRNDFDKIWVIFGDHIRK
jgi:hypothetical protein